MKRVVLMVGLLAATTACHRRHVDRAPAAQSATARSGAFHLEQGGLYERFNDSSSALAEYEAVTTTPDSAEQRAQAFIAIARLQTKARQYKLAVQAYDAARTEIAKIEAVPGRAQRSALNSDSVALELASALIAGGDSQRAHSIISERLKSAASSFQRAQLIRLDQEALRTAGLLDATIADLEKRLGDGKLTESEIRLLLATYGDGGASMMSAPTAPAALGEARPAVPAKLLLALERLHAAAPNDDEVRRRLISVYRANGRIDDAIELVRANVAANTVAAAPSCPSTDVGDPATATTEEIVRILRAANRKTDALAEVRSLVSTSIQHRQLAPLRVAIRLFAELGAADEAERTLASATRMARDDFDRRLIMVARGELLLATGRRSEAQALFAQWRVSDDACLKDEAARREQALAQSTMVPLTGGKL